MEAGDLNIKSEVHIPLHFVFRFGWFLGCYINNEKQKSIHETQRDPGPPGGAAGGGGGGSKFCFWMIGEA